MGRDANLPPTSLTFNDAGNLLSEAYSGGPLGGLTVTNRYDAWLRRATNGLWNGSTWQAQTRYGYDDAGRLQTVASGTNTMAYSYLADSALVGDIGFTNGSTLRMTTIKSYDYLNRLTNILTVGAGLGTLDSHAYAYNSANQRTSVTNADNARWVYQYDALGQVVSGKKYWSDGTPVAGQHFEYTFDDIGNRQSTKAGGDNGGANLRSAGYSVNALNQYGSREVPGYENVFGTASNNATVTLWGDNGAYSSTVRKGDYFRGELYADNATGAVWLTITNVAVLNNGANPDIVTNAVGRTFLPKTTETFVYDADGNLTNDGRWSYTWDAENRVTSFTRITSAPSGAKVKVDCQYDSRWRRTQKIVSAWNGSAYTAQSTNRFVYDGWNLIAILDHQSSILYSFTWGTDASGSMQGAGGVGGLISMTVHQGANAGTYFYCYDGNHNVVAFVNAANGAVAAQWEYGTFGNLLRATGPMAFDNPFLFSTKFYDWETGFCYYGYRYYDPDTGRWPSRDPILERGGRNLYRFARNDPVNFIDQLGLCAADCTAGCNRAGCEVRVVPAGYSPGSYKTIEELAVLYHQTHYFGLFVASAMTGAASLCSLEEGIATGIGHAVGHVLMTPGQAIAKVAPKLLDRFGHHIGWMPFVKVSYQTCVKRCKLGQRVHANNGYWKDLAGSKDWEPVKGDLPITEGFTSVEEALKAGLKKCDEKTATFREKNKICN